MTCPSASKDVYEDNHVANNWVGEVIINLSKQKLLFLKPRRWKTCTLKNNKTLIKKFTEISEKILHAPGLAKIRLWKTYGYRWGELQGRGGMDHGFGFGICTLRYMEWLASGDLLYNTENSTQHFLIIYLGKESERMDVCTCITESLCCSAEIITTL